MRIMLDTNVLISMLFFPSKAFQDMLKHITENHTLVISTFILDEVNQVAAKKFPEKKADVDKFFTNLSFDLVYTPHRMQRGLFEIRDKMDYPILYTAIIDDVDIFITGDKDFFDVDVSRPVIITPAAYVEQYCC